MRAPACPASFLLLALLSVAGTTRAHGQTPGRFTGTVVDSTGAPIAGVEVLLTEGNRRITTDTAGRFVLGGLSPGLYHVALRRFQFQAITGTVRLASGDSVDITFRMRHVAQQLDAVRVRGRANPGDLEGFEQRRAQGFGTFITSDVLDQLATLPLQNIIASRSPKTQVVHLRAGGFAIANVVPQTCTGERCTSTPLCYMSIWVDGIEVYDPDAGESPPDLSRYTVPDLVGVEVYSGPASTPLEFGGTGASCGAVVMWTRTGPRKR